MAKKAAKVAARTPVSPPKSRDVEPPEDEQEEQDPQEEQDDPEDDDTDELEDDDSDEDDDEDQDDEDDEDDDSEGDWSDDDIPDDWEDEDEDDDDDSNSDEDDEDDDYEDDGDEELAAKVKQQQLEGPPKRRPTRPSGKLVVEDSTFPPPPAKRISDWRAFTTYWRSIYDNPKYRPRLRIYVYRMFPLMLEGHRQVAKLTGDPPQGDKHLDAKPLTIQDILKRWGSGSYSFRINDAGAPRSLKEVCYHIMDGRAELNDFDNFPPVLDIDKVDPDFPGNASYVRSMQSRTKWSSEEEEKETMKEVLQFAERMLDQRANASARDSSAEKNAVDLMAHASKSAIEIVTAQAKHSGGNGNQDSVNVMTGMLGIFEKMASAMQQPKQDGASDKIFQLMLDAQAAERAARAENMAMMRETITAMAAMHKQPEAPQAKEDKLTERLEEMRLLKDIAREFGRGAGGGSAAAGFDWTKLLPLAAPAITALTALLGKLAQNQGVPAAALPPAMTQEQYEAYLRSQPGMAPGMQAQASGMPQEGPQEAQEGIENLPADFRSAEGVQRFMEQLKDPLIRHLNDTESDGFEFADWYVQWKGEEHYDALRSMGVDTLMQVLQSYPPIWEHLESRQAKARQFIEQFCADPEPQEDYREYDVQPDAVIDPATVKHAEPEPDYSVVGQETARIALSRSTTPAKAEKVAAESEPSAKPKRVSRKKAAK